MTFLFLILFGYLAPALEGHFIHAGDFNILSSTRYETVYTTTQKGQERLALLRSEGYLCQPKLQFMQCQKHTNETSLPTDMTNLSPQVSDVEFGTLLSLSPISQGEDVAIYEASQTVTVDGVTYDKAQYLERADLVKISVGAPGKGDYHSFVIYTDFIGSIEQSSHTESKWAYTIYQIEFYLKRTSHLSLLMESQSAFLPMTF